MRRRNDMTLMTMYMSVLKSLSHDCIEHMLMNIVIWFEMSALGVVRLRCALASIDMLLLAPPSLLTAYTTPYLTTEAAAAGMRR